MDEIKQRLEAELHSAVDRIRRMGGAVIFEDYPGALGEQGAMADEVDAVQVNETREMSFATRSMLVQRANKLAEALQRLRQGEYGTCEICEEAIAPARLRAMPEVTTCVKCQDQLERQRSLQPAGAPIADDEDED